MVTIKQSKPISEIKQGDKIKIDGKEYEVDVHEVLMEHKDRKGRIVNEMVIEVFDPVTDKDYQVRYFPDNLELSLEFYELKEIVYERVEINEVEW